MGCAEEGLEDDEAAAEMIWNPLLKFLFSQPWFTRRKQMDHIFLFADGQSARVWDSYGLVQSEAIFMMVELLGTDQQDCRIKVIGSS